MPRVAIGLEYDGTDFVGWQAQANGLSVQSAVEAAVARVANEPVRVHGSGRTDAGVHAAGQVAHFNTSARRDERQWLLGINSNLPATVAATWIREVPAHFDARRSAVWREYRYTILNQSVRPALDRHRVWWVREPLDLAVMTQIAAAWLGEHDFSAMRAAHCQSHSPVRNLMRVAVERDQSYIHIAVRANAFVYHMVRNMVGTLVDIGRGRMSVDAGARVLGCRDRRQAGITAPAAGLLLATIAYEAVFAVPGPKGVRESGP